MMIKKVVASIILMLCLLGSAKAGYFFQTVYNDSTTPVTADMYMRGGRFTVGNSTADYNVQITTYAVWLDSNATYGIREWNNLISYTNDGGTTWLYIGATASTSTYAATAGTAAYSDNSGLLAGLTYDAFLTTTGANTMDGSLTHVYGSSTVYKAADGEFAAVIYTDDLPDRLVILVKADGGNLDLFSISGDITLDPLTVGKYIYMNDRLVLVNAGIDGQQHDIYDINKGTFNHIWVSSITGTSPVKFQTDIEMQGNNIYDVAKITATEHFGSGPDLTDIKWNGVFLDTDSLTAGALIRYDGTDFIRIASGTVAGTYLKQDFTWTTPAGAGDTQKAVDEIITGDWNFNNTITTFTNITVEGDANFSDANSTVTVAGNIVNWGIPTAMCNFDGDTAGYAIRYGVNVTSITHVSTGQYIVNFATPMDNTDYIVLGLGAYDGTISLVGIFSGVDQIYIRVLNSSDPSAYADLDIINIVVYGGK